MDYFQRMDIEFDYCMDKNLFFLHRVIEALENEEGRTAIQNWVYFKALELATQEE